MGVGLNYCAQHWETCIVTVIVAIEGPSLSPKGHKSERALERESYLKKPKGKGSRDFLWALIMGPWLVRLIHGGGLFCRPPFGIWYGFGGV